MPLKMNDRYFTYFDEPESGNMRGMSRRMALPEFETSHYRISLCDTLFLISRSRAPDDIPLIPYNGNSGRDEQPTCALETI